MTVASSCMDEYNGGVDRLIQLLARKLYHISQMSNYSLKPSVEEFKMIARLG